MKKSFTYLSGVMLASLLFSFDSADAGLFGSKKKNVEKDPTPYETILGDTDKKETANIFSEAKKLFANADKQTKSSMSKMEKLYADKKTYDNKHDLASPEYILIILSSMSEYLRLTSMGIGYMLDGINSIGKARKEGDKSETEGRKNLSQGMKMLRLSEIFSPTLQAYVVILNRYLEDTKAKINNSGEVKQSITNLKTLLEDRKKTDGLATKIEKIIKKIDGMLSADDSEIQPMLENCKENMETAKDIAESFSTFLDALVGHLNGNKNKLSSLAEEYDQKIKGAKRRRN